VNQNKKKNSLYIRKRKHKDLTDSTKSNKTIIRHYIILVEKNSLILPQRFVLPIIPNLPKSNIELTIGGNGSFMLDEEKGTRKKYNGKKRIFLFT